MTFDELVTAWLREQIRDDGAELISVDSYGTDYAGDTMHGFYSEFEVRIRYRKSDSDQEQRLYLQGEDMERLWMRVVGAFPSA